MALFDDRKQRMFRLFQLCARLDARRNGERLTTRILAELCHCSGKTIQRDLALVRAIGVPVEWAAGEGSFVLKGALPFRHIELTLGQVLALCLARESLAQPDEPLIWQAQGVFDSIAQLLPAPLREVLETAQNTISVGNGAKRSYSAVPLLPLHRAVKERRTVQMRYYTQSRGEESTRSVDPYKVVQRNGYWNLIAWCHQRREVRLFSLDMIRGVEPTDRHFEVCPDFELETYLHGSISAMRGDLTTIRVLFDARIASWARRHRWPFPHTLAEVPEGGLQLQGEVSGLEGIRNELLRWGAHFQVLEPLELREAIHREALAMAEKNAITQKARPTAHQNSKKNFRSRQSTDSKVSTPRS